ncbi:rho guanine nucleotide exchange factor 17-like [Tachypleus tridentatus]|uniref:rho guanine nucleotide exchange factor 17-like n=1 Tax=Tachypleus tridentatus TaxID=6853 RepID=UPI003FD6634F
MDNLVTDTRTHVVGELFDTEKSYVDSLQILVNKYMKPLKSSEYMGVIEPSLVNDIFLQIPEILAHHESFLEKLRQRLTNWDTKQKVGDVFVEAFTKEHVIDTYTTFINNWKFAKDVLKLTTQTKPAFQKFLEHTSREHKGKLTLDALLIMPVQRIPRYELLIKVSHTPVDHPDHQSLVLAQKEVHELAVKINKMERQAFQYEQLQQRVRDIENVIEGAVDLVQPDRTFIRYDDVMVSGGIGSKKERSIFLFSDLLLITSVKRKSGTTRKTSSASLSPSMFGCLEMNKYKLLYRLPLDSLDTGKNGDSSSKKTLREVECLEEDIAVLGHISDLASTLRCHHQTLDEAIQELLNTANKQLVERQAGDSELLRVELTVTTQEGNSNIQIVFPTPEKKYSWKTAFNEAKHKLVLHTDRRPPPQFLFPLPVRKTRAGLQFTCATPALGYNHLGFNNVWICNSDGYVGQVYILTLQPEPTLTSCKNICNARILCITSVPGIKHSPLLNDSYPDLNLDTKDAEEEDRSLSTNGNLQMDSDFSDNGEEDSESPDEHFTAKQNYSARNYLGRRDSDEEGLGERTINSTIWLGTEDGCALIYDCKDDAGTSQNRITVQHSAAVRCITYFDDKVFVSLANAGLYVYRRNEEGNWNTTEFQRVQVGSVSSPVTHMLAVAGKLWCGWQNHIKILSVRTMEEEHCFQVSSDTSRAVVCMVASGFGVWLATQHSSTLKLFHAISYENLLEVSIAPAVTKMLAVFDDIIRQHKAACLRVTALLTCNDLLWIGTSAGVILFLPLPHLTISTSKLNDVPNVSGDY